MSKWSGWEKARMLISRKWGKYCGYTGRSTVGLMRLISKPTKSSKKGHSQMTSQGCCSAKYWDRSYFSSSLKLQSNKATDIYRSQWGSISSIGYTGSSINIKECIHFSIRNCMGWSIILTDRRKSIFLKIHNLVCLNTILTINCLESWFRDSWGRNSWPVIISSFGRRL